MGRASRNKWIGRAEAYEDKVLRGTKNAEASKAYLDQFSGKLQKFMKGAKDLEAERQQDAAEAQANEPKGKD